MEAQPSERLYHDAREARFSQLGFDSAQAMMLADSTVALHDAQDLIDQRCPPDVAFDILREFEVS